MKKTLLFFGVFCLPLLLSAQTSLKHIKGAMTVSAGGLMTDNSFGGFVGESYWFSTKLNWDLRLQFLTGSEGYTEFSSLSLDNQLALNFFSAKNKFYTDFVFGGQVGFDSYTSSVEDKSSKTSIMAVGELGIKAKFYFNYAWSVWLEGKECYGYSKINHHYPQFALGCSWMLPGINNKSSRKFN